MNPTIVLISTQGDTTPKNHSSWRGFAEDIEGSLLTNSEHLFERVTAEGDIEVQVLPLTYFMDMCNNEEFNPDDWWLSYVFFTDLEKQNEV